MSKPLNDNIRMVGPKPLDDKYYNGLIPYTSTGQVNSLINPNDRYKGLTVLVGNDEFWYYQGIADGNLVAKPVNSGGSFSVSREKFTVTSVSPDGTTTVVGTMIGVTFNKIVAIQRGQSVFQDIGQAGTPSQIGDCVFISATGQLIVTPNEQLQPGEILTFVYLN